MPWHDDYIKGKKQSMKHFQEIDTSWWNIICPIYMIYATLPLVLT